MEEKLKKKIERLKITKLILIVILMIETLILAYTVTHAVVMTINEQKRDKEFQQLKIEAYNQKFQTHIGQNVKGISVKYLYDIVKKHNIDYGEEPSLIVSINDKTMSADLDAEKAEIVQSKVYKVEVPSDGYDSNTGYIIKIKVTETTKVN